MEYKFVNQLITKFLIFFLYCQATIFPYIASIHKRTNYETDSVLSIYINQYNAYGSVATD